MSVGALDARGLERGEQRRVEVQSGGRRGNRSACAREHGLIALAIRARSARWMYGGSGTWPMASTASMTDPASGREPNPAAPEELPLEHLPVQRGCAALEDHRGPGLQLLPGMHQRVPDFRAGRVTRAIDARQEQALDGAAGRHAPSEQPRGKHAGVVDDNQVARI